MKRLTTLLLAAGLVFGISTGSAQAIDFKAQGQWLMGFTYGQGGMVKKVRDENGRHQPNNNDQFEASQRVRLQLHAVASENLSGTLYFEIGDSTWGKAGKGAALGADDKIVEVKRAYLDWVAPETALKVRMGVQGVALPSAAGGTSVLDDDVAGVVASYQFNDNVGLTAMWLRPWNDNYPGKNTTGNPHAGFLDNADIFALALPLKFDGVEVTPWLSYGMLGRNLLNPNAADKDNNSVVNFANWGGYYGHSFITSGYADNGRWASTLTNSGSKAYADAFWAGLPIKVSALDPFNIEFDFNYGYVGSLGRGYMFRSDGKVKRFDTKSEGWLVKALFEYKMDWGVPGILGWYASGDDDNPNNGSERMPSVGPCANFTSTFGDGNYGWGTSGKFYDRSLTYSGTWGVGLQIRDMSFMENLKHTFRAVYRGGTNSPSMAKYAARPWSWGTGVDGLSTDNNELYLTTNDGILEFNLVNAWKLYENFEVNLELGYAVNFIDHSTWKKSYSSRNYGDSFQKQDAWKAQLIFAYQF